MFGKFNYKIIDVRDRGYSSVTVDGLSYSPAEMAKMISKGISVSTSNFESQFYDGSTDVSAGVPFEHQRGIDIVDAWNVEQDAKTKIYNKVKENNK